MSDATEAEARSPTRRNALPEKIRRGEESVQRAIADLRAATAEAHRTLESHPIAARLMSPQVQIIDLAAFLTAQFRALEAWSSGCPEPLRQTAGVDYGERVAALRRDLHELGLDPPSRRMANAPSWESSAPEWWGALYVVEGSRLGGRVIARHLRSMCCMASVDAFRFLESRTERPWPELLARIGEHVGDASSRTRGIEGASRMFSLFAEAFDASFPILPTQKVSDR
jgi:heme oxygenase